MISEDNPLKKRKPSRHREEQPTEKRSALPLNPASLISPLYSAEAEKAVIGSMIAHPPVIDSVTDTLSKEDFFLPPMQTLFDAIVSLHQTQQAIDIMTVHQWLQDRKLANGIGSPGILAEVVAMLVSHLNISTHVRIVREKSLLRRLQQACVNTAEDIADDTGDVEALIDRAEARITAVTLSVDMQGEIPFRDSVDAVLRNVYEWTLQGRTLQGLTTGFKKLNEFTTGWIPGDSVVIGARPGVGKTAWLLKNAMELAKEGIHVAFFSLEMSREQLILRLVAMHAAVSLQHMRAGKLTDHELEKVRWAQKQVAGWPLHIEDTPHMTLQRIRSRMRQLKAKYGIDMAFIDYLGLIEVKGKFANRHEVVGIISRGIKSLAKELFMPIMTAAQLRRNENREPTLEDLRESGDIEQDADAVILLHRNPDDVEDLTQAIPYHAILAKQRQGPTGVVKAWYSAWRSLFVEVNEEEKK